MKETFVGNPRSLGGPHWGLPRMAEEGPWTVELTRKIRKPV